jgi:hypothetical protein
MEWLRHYQQVRFMYARGGIWDSNVAATRRPFPAAVAKEVQASL